MPVNERRFDPLAQEMPSDTDAERILIATAIEHETRLRESIILIRPEYLMLEAHRIIWAHVCEMFDAGSMVSQESIRAYFGTGPGRENIASIGGFGYLAEFMTPQANVSVSAYAQRILDTYARRALMFKCNDALLRLVDKSIDVAEVAGELEEQARVSAVLGKESSGFKNFEDMVRECGGIEAFLARGKGDSMSYPWPTLTKLTNGGLKPTQFTVIAGESGKGKTALLLNILFRAACSGNGVPLLFSLEMDKQEIGTRMLSLASRVDSFRFGYLMPEDRERIRRGRAILAENQYLVDDQDCASMAQIKARVKEMLSRGPVSLVAIDTIQLVEGRKGVRENREQEIARITRDMKRMAMHLKVPVIGLSQINDLETGREPDIRNMRDSRTIWHNANNVMFLHFTQPYDMQAGIPVGELDLILAKQRGGPAGRMKLHFHAPTGLFYEIESEE